MRKCVIPAVSASHLAEIAGLSVSQLNRLVSAGVMPKAKRAVYATEKALRALIDYYRQGREGTGNIAVERLRLTVAQRKALEQTTAIKARELVPADEVQTLFCATLAMSMSQLDGMGGRLCNDMAAQSDPAICKKVMFDETRRIRAALAADLQSFADSGGRIPNGGAASGNDRV